MSKELSILAVTAASIGFLHTLLGPDHYVPFIALARARRWSVARTAIITLLCGIGHVGSSVVLGLVGIAMGIAVSHLEVTESFRGNIAAWLLTGFGLAYLVWGIRRAYRNKPHRHLHSHDSGESHAHEHTHDGAHAHPSEQPGRKNLTPWVLFLVFVFGPCEPLIPVLMYPAATESIWGVVLVAGLFSAVTIGTMLTLVLLASSGLMLLPTGRLERFSHALAGAAVLGCGLAIHLGL